MTMTGTKTMTHANNGNGIDSNRDDGDNGSAPTMNPISPVISMGGLTGAKGSGKTGRVKMLNPICRVPSLRKENMTSKQLSEFCFLPTDKLPHHRFRTATHSSAQVSTPPPIEHTSFNNPTVIHQPISRIGRENQRYALSPTTRLPTTRITVGSVPILRDGRILMVSSSRKANWILPKGGWESDESCEDAALRETYEECGLLGALGEKLETLEFRRLEGGRTTLETIQSVEEFVEGERGCVEGEEADRLLVEERSVMTDSDERRRRMVMFPLYVMEVRETWPESGRARKAVDIDTAIEMVEGRPEFQTVLREVKEKGHHLLHPSMEGEDAGDRDVEIR